MHKIVIFGSTGMTGSAALEHAVKQGYDVRVLVRNPSKIPEHLRNKIEIVVGDVYNDEQVSQAVAGRDAVVVVLGTPTLDPTTLMSDGTKQVIKAMKAHGVKLISACMSGYIFYKPEDVPPMFRHVTEDHHRMMNALRESGLDWIAVLPPHIESWKSIGFKVEHGKKPPGRIISKYDLANFLIDCLRQPEHIGQLCGITSQFQE